MDNGVCTLNVNNTAFSNCCSIFCEDPLQDSLDAPMPLIGIYIATASAVCLFSVLYDALSDLGTIRFWFPSKYFSLSSFTLTLLAIAMKLPVDLTGKMTGPADRLARITSLVFMSTSMANFMTCLGSMGNNEILLNTVSLGILVITIAVNVCIRNVRMSSFHFDGRQEIIVEEIVCTVVMILMLAILVSSSIIVPYIKGQIEGKYNTISNPIRKSGWGRFHFEDLRKIVMGYWVFTRTGSPQFVVARSPICAIPGILCLLMASLTLLRVVSQLPSVFRSNDLGSNSSYKWSTIGILTVQSTFVALSSIAPVFRWFSAARLKSRKMGSKSLKDELKVETYWTEILVNWKKGPLHTISRPLVANKVAVKSRNLLLSFCCGVQIAIVCMSKLVLLISAKIFSCCSYFSGQSRDDEMEQDINDAARDDDMEQDINDAAALKDVKNYVLLLDEEGEPSKKTLRNLCNNFEKVINLNKKQQPEHLIKLLLKSDNLNGVREFEDPGHNSWSLRIMTLASVVIALPNITTDMSDQLLRGVSEGFEFVRIIETAENKEDASQYASFRNAVDAIWKEVELERRWLGIDISQKSCCRNYKDALQKLRDKARNFISSDYEYKSAKEMYEISDAILKADKDQTEEQLFESLSVIISEMLSACLTNLNFVIGRMCDVSDIDKREESVRQAAILLCKSEEVLKILNKHEFPEPGMMDFRRWRRFMYRKRGIPQPSYPPK